MRVTLAGKRLPVGKLDMYFLKDLLSRYSLPDERVVVGPKIGGDAAVIDFGDRYLVAKTDPVTFATDKIGWYMVHVNANDIACTGATPRWLLTTILLPENGADKESVEKIFSQVADACRSINVSLTGGHTEITGSVSSPVLVGQMLGEVEKEKLVDYSNARSGDHILLTKGIAIEGTALLAMEKENYLLDAGYHEEFIERCKSFIHDPGISILREASIAAGAFNVTSMHDPTEGGLSTAITELAEASGCGVEVHSLKIDVYDECRILCEEFGLESMGVIASGSLLLTAPPEEASGLLNEYAKQNINCRRIGTLVEEEKGRTLITPRGRRPLPVYSQDEVAKVL
jgi:hydrogenase maturation factor